MSARGAIVTNPGKKNSKMVSESKRYIPLFWFGLIPEEKWSPDTPAQYSCLRAEVVERGRSCVGFLAEVFSDIDNFAQSAEQLLDKLTRLKCETIGIDVAELTEPEPLNPDLGAALKMVAEQDKNFHLSIPARTVPNPFLLGETVDFPAKEIASTRELLQTLSWLTPREIETANAELLHELVIGYVWD